MAQEEQQQPNQSKTQAASTVYYPGGPYYGMELARAYIPIQKLGDVYPPGKALETGTLFPELYRPYPY